MSTDRVWRRFVEDKDRHKLSGWLLDKLADEAENPQQWDQSRKNLCGECHTYRSRNGSCLCEGGET